VYDIRIVLGDGRNEGLARIPDQRVKAVLVRRGDGEGLDENARSPRAGQDLGLVIRVREEIRDANLGRKPSNRSVPCYTLMYFACVPRVENMSIHEEHLTPEVIKLGRMRKVISKAADALLDLDGAGVERWTTAAVCGLGRDRRRRWQSLWRWRNVRRRRSPRRRRGPRRWCIEDLRVVRVARCRGRWGRRGRLVTRGRT
jgi:hypothetical protein